jgi:hypothetical protein
MWNAPNEGDIMSDRTALSINKHASIYFQEKVDVAHCMLLWALVNRADCQVSLDCFGQAVSRAFMISETVSRQSLRFKRLFCQGSILGFVGFPQWNAISHIATGLSPFLLSICSHRNQANKFLSPSVFPSFPSVFSSFPFLLFPPFHSFPKNLLLWCT